LYGCTFAVHLLLQRREASWGLRSKARRVLYETQSATCLFVANDVNKLSFMNMTYSPAHAILSAVFLLRKAF
jgi:hypothetical protein